MVSGAVHVLGGYLVVDTSGHRMKIVVDERDGIARPLDVTPSEKKGTRVEFYMDLSEGRYCNNDTWWIDQAVRLAKGDCYSGKTSPYWYDADSFFDLTTSAPKDTTVRQFIETFDGCTGKKAAEISEPYKNGTYRLIRDLTKDEAGALLKRAREAATPVTARRLGYVGEDAFAPRNEDEEPFFYSRKEGEFTPSHRSTGAFIPFVVEVWARVTDANASASLYINRTPVCQPLSLSWRSMGNKTEDKYLALAGLGLSGDMTVSAIHGIKKPVSIQMNIITPYIPITSTGKSPDLHQLKSVIIDAIETAAKKAIKAEPKEPERNKEQKTTFKHFVYSVMDKAIAHTSGGHTFNQRNLFYTVRNWWISAGNEDPQMGTFTQYITEYESEYGPIPKMTRDPRGSIYHPHEGTEIPLGTKSVDNYQRPEWVFNKVLFVEKEGFFDAMRELNWPEEHDCSLISSKGNANRAAKDVIDQIGETGEPVTVYCVHDADAYGTQIYEKLQGATKARPARKITIVNLGIEPWTAMEDMGLIQEKVKKKNENRRPVADYVKEYDRVNKTQWEAWLQDYRIEVNQLTTPEFIKYVDAQIAKHGDVGKVIPPDAVIQALLDEKSESLIHEKALEALRSEIEAKEAEFKAKVEATDIEEIRSFIVDHLVEIPKASWKDAVDSFAYLVVSDETSTPPGPAGGEMAISTGVGS